MTRPLARIGIDELEAMFERSKHDLPALKQLIVELAYRNVPRATGLLDKARRVLKFVESRKKESTSGASTPTDMRDRTGTSTPTPNGFGFEIPIFAPAELPRRLAKPGPTSNVQPVPVVLPTFTATTASVTEPEPIAMSVEQSYRILKVTSASTWDVIEFSRRQLVARAQPDKVARLEPSKRKALLDEAREANIAYKVLMQARTQ